METASEKNPQQVMASIEEYVKTDVGVAAEYFDAVWQQLEKTDKNRCFRLIYGALTDETIAQMVAAANRGSDTAVAMLGKGFFFKKLHRNGVESMEEAAHWLELSVAKRHESAMYRLAVLLRKGDGVKKDLNRSFLLAYEAMTKNHDWADLALCEIALLYTEALGDFVKAAQMYRLAANYAQCLTAQYELGRLCLEGRGVDRNLSEAKCFLELAVSGAGDKYLNTKRNASALLKKIPESCTAAKWTPSGVLGELPPFLETDYEKAKAGALFDEDEKTRTETASRATDFETEGSENATVEDVVVKVTDYKTSSASSTHVDTNKRNAASVMADKNAKHHTDDASKTKQAAGISPKKRIVFLLLGFLLGWLGVHFLYAKRYILCTLTVASFVTLIVSAVSNLMGLFAIAVLLLIILGPLFALFGKKDGHKLRMKWF